MHVINNLELVHGIAVLPKQQTAGVGRSCNQVNIPAFPDMYKVSAFNQISVFCFDSGLVP